MEDQAQWVGLRATVVITESQIYFFEGYSHHFGAYWRSEGDADDNDGKPNYFHTEMALRQHAPLWLYTRLLCDNGPRGKNRVKGSPTLNIHCSKSIAEAKMTALMDTAASYGLPIAMKLRFHVLAVDVAVWLGQLMQVFTSHVILFLFLYVPSAYCAVNLLRHVDTPTASVNQVATISVYTYAPLMVFTDVSAMLLRYGLTLKDSAEVSAVVSVETSLWCLTGVEHLLQAFWCQLGMYLAWTAYVFMLLRARDETTKCAAAAAARGRRMEQQASTSYEDDFSGEPTCRICLGDEFDGRMISPCLCKGSMRFVHIECLTQWRTTSRNKESFFACDSCQYRYSFRRPGWASMLRSALVVHFVTLVLFVILIAICGHTANLADYLFFDGGLGKTLGLNFDDDQMAELMELYGEAGGGLINGDYSLLGLSMVQLTTGAMVVGIGGFISSGFVTALLWGRRDNGIFLFAIIYGLGISFMKVYGMVKASSSGWLKLAESSVVDVGEGVQSNGYVQFYMVRYYRAGITDAAGGGGTEPQLADWYGTAGSV